MNKKLTFSLTTGAAAIAIFVVLYSIFSINEETTQELVGILTMLPLTIYTRKYGVKSGLICMAAAILLSLFTVPQVTFVTYVIPSAIIGTTLGMFILKLNAYASVAILSVLNVVRLLYELAITSFFTKISIAKQYVITVSQFSNFLTDNITNSALTQLLNDMFLCGIPVLFIIGAVAKAALCYIISCITLNRIFKHKISLVMPKFKADTTICSVSCLVTCISGIVLSLLIALGKVKYTFAFAIILDIVLVILYVYLIFFFRYINDMFKVRSIARFLLTLIMIVLFVITDMVFSIYFILNHKKYHSLT